MQNKFCLALVPCVSSVSGRLVKYFAYPHTAPTNRVDICESRVQFQQLYRDN